MSGFAQGVGALWYALRYCDEYEHIVCDNGHEVGADTNLSRCPRCGDELKVRLDRPLMVRLALQEIRTSIFPYRLYSFEPESPTCELTWRWRGRTIHRRRVPNSLYSAPPIGGGAK